MVKEPGRQRGYVKASKKEAAGKQSEGEGLLGGRDNREAERGSKADRRLEKKAPGNVLEL